MLIRFRRPSPRPTSNASRGLSVDQSAARCDLKRLVNDLQRLALVAPNAVRFVGDFVAGLLDEVDY